MGFITSSIEQWFKPQVKESLQRSLEVAQFYYRDFAGNMVSSAQQISKQLSKQGPRKGEKGMRLVREELEEKRQEYRLSTLGVFLRGEGSSMTVEDPVLKTVFSTPPKVFTASGIFSRSNSSQKKSRVNPHLPQMKW